MNAFEAIEQAAELLATFVSYDHCDACRIIARYLPDPPTQDELRGMES